MQVRWPSVRLSHVPISGPATSATLGRCLCGAVTVHLPHEVDAVEACHCALCRRWGSGPWLGIEAPPGTTVEGDTLTVYPSSRLAERGFCSRCGSNVFYRFRSGSELVVSSGLFDAPHLVLRGEIFHHRKPAFYRFTGTTRKRTALASAIHWLPILAARRIRRSIGL